MKLVLCSDGFRTPNTVQACVELCSKPQDEMSIAVINEGYAVEPGDKYWVINNLNDAANNFKGGLRLVNLLALSLDKVEEIITECDVILVIGGNPDYLMHVFEKTGFAKLLPKLLETKVYVGSSAGSMVMGRRLSDPLYTNIYSGRGNWGVSDYMGLVDLAFVAHLNSSETPNNRSEILREVDYREKFPLYGLQDDCAIILNGDELRCIGSAPLKREPQASSSPSN